MLVVTICLAVAATALAIWWLNSLNGLPDIGDPFDVAAFRTFRIPDDQNAFTLLRRAWKASRAHLRRRLVRDQSGVPRVGRGEPPGGGTDLSRGPTSGWDIRAGRRADAGENNVVDYPIQASSLGADRDDAYGGRSCAEAGRHGRRLGLLSRRPPHDGPRPAAREADGSRCASLSGSPYCRNVSRPGRRIPGPRSPRFDAPWRRWSSAGPGPSGMRSHSRSSIWTSCDSWTGVSIPLPNRSRRSGPIVWVRCSCPSIWRSISTR